MDSEPPSIPSRLLANEFGSGVSIANLKNFRQFYLTFPDAGKSYALRSLSFPGLPENQHHAERDLECALTTRLRDFLMEMGKGFSFVGRQFRVSTETSHFYVDLVFYNYLLKCFVLLDLKTKKLTHADIGQMDMYVRLFDDLKRGEGDNPTLGIILCTDKDDTLVRYSVLQESQQLFASKYRLVLPSEDELREELERRHILELPEGEGGEDE